MGIQVDRRPGGQPGSEACRQPGANKKQPRPSQGAAKGQRASVMYVGVCVVMCATVLMYAYVFVYICLFIYIYIYIYV